jgi:hypothetical protein
VRLASLSLPKRFCFSTLLACRELLIRPGPRLAIWSGSAYRLIVILNRWTCILEDS